MSGELVVRAMARSDLRAVMRIERQAFTMPWTEATFRSLLRRPDADLLSAELNGELVGYAVLWTVVDQGELGDLAVAPAARRCGVASRLIEAVLERARERGVKEVYLEVRVSNEAAQRLYARYGFREAGRRRGYYLAPKEDAIVLVRKI